MEIEHELLGSFLQEVYLDHSPVRTKHVSNFFILKITFLFDIYFTTAALNTQLKIWVHPLMFSFRITKMR